MVFTESELNQLAEDTRVELTKVSRRRQELKALSSDIQGIKMTGREQVTPAVPEVLDPDDATIVITPAVPESRKTMFDVTPRDRSTGGDITSARRQKIYDNLMSEKTKMGI